MAGFAVPAQHLAPLVAAHAVKFPLSILFLCLNSLSIL